MFRDLTTGAFQETVTGDTNLINLDTDSYNLLVHKCAELAFQQQSDFGSQGGGVQADKWEIKYTKTLKRYKALYKSDIVKPKGYYYRTGNRRGDRGARGRFTGDFFN